jgi:hypothetical protein
VNHLEETFELERVHVPVWAWLLAATAVLALYAMAMDNGAALAAGASTLHELFHDARHFAGVPCH